jgi:hypothetical protein
LVAHVRYNLLSRWSKDGGSDDANGGGTGGRNR